MKQMILAFNLKYVNSFILVGDHNWPLQTGKVTAHFECPSMSPNHIDIFQKQQEN